MVISDAALSVIVVLVIFVYYYFNSVYNYWHKRGVVGPQPIPFFGNFKESALRRKHAADLYKEIYDDFPGEKIVGFYKMASPSLLIRDLDIVKQILIKDFEVFPDRGLEFSKTGLGDSLFHCDLPTWKGLRSHLTPLFTTEKLKHAVTLLSNESDKFIDLLKTVCLKRKEHEIMQLFQKYAIASIMVCFFGINVNTIDDNAGVFEQVDQSIFIIPIVNEIELLYPGFLKKTNTSIFGKKAIKYCYEVVRATKHQNKSDYVANNNLMDILFALQHKGELKYLKSEDKEVKNELKITDHVIASQVLIFYAAGYANNTYILSYTMYYLAKNPDIQNKLIAEIEEVLQKFNGEINYESINEMKYLDQVFCETLRKHPTANSLQRAASRSYVVPGVDVKLDRGYSIVISPLAIHNDEKIYPNPDQFDPDRFTPENVRNRHSCAYLPFGTGPRSCIAIRFAKLQFKVCAVKFLSKFRVEPSGKTKNRYSINPHRTLLGPAGGIYLNIIPRS